MNKFKIVIVTFCMFPLLAHAGSMIRSNSSIKNIPSVSRGSESGGGGSATARSPVGSFEIRYLIGQIHKNAKYLFNFINNDYDDNLKYRKVMNQLKKAVHQDNQFFDKLQVSIDETECRDTKGATKMASYSNGVICFSSQLIQALKYSGQEAPSKLAALYLHEVAHAAGFTGSAEDEALLHYFQKYLEGQLAAVEYNPAFLRDTILMDKETSNLEQRLPEMAKAKDEKRSLVWLCVRLQHLVKSTQRIPMVNARESNGLNLLTQDQASIAALLGDEAEVLAAVNCDGYAENFYIGLDWNALAEVPQQVISLVQALKIVNDGSISYCREIDNKHICKLATEINVNTKPQSLEQFRVQVSNWAAKTYKYLRQFDRVQ